MTGEPGFRELPEEAAVTLESPAFAVSYPAILHKERIPPGPLHAMELSWNRTRFDPRPVGIHRLRNVHVAFDGLVFDEQHRLFSASVTQHTPDDIANARRWLEEGIEAGAVTRHSGPAVLCKKRGVENYGHWLIEMLPKAWIARQHLGNEELSFVVATPGPALELVMQRSLQMLGIEDGRIFWTGKQPTFFEELILLDGLTDHGRYYSPLILGCLDVLSAAAPAGKMDRLYVNRDSAAYRDFANRDALAPVLEERGYLSIDPGQLAFDLQIAAFKGARSIAGVIGAGLANIAFAEPEARVQIFVPRSMPDTMFWFLANLCGLAYREIRCEQVGPIRGHADWDTDVTIEPEEFRAIIQAEI